MSAGGAKGIPADNVLDALKVDLASAYANVFNQFGRTYQVAAQAGGRYWQTLSDAAGRRVRRRRMLPIGVVTTFQDITTTFAFIWAWFRSASRSAWT